MEINSITFNGINSLEYGLYVSGDKTFNSAEKDYSKVSVPGRSGDLLIFNNRFKNVNVSYQAILIEDYKDSVRKVASWLLSADGYCRLEDTYHPDEFRIASFSGPIDFDTKMLMAGETTLTFDCKPQRWLKSGEEQITITKDHYAINDDLLYNFTSFASKPLIQVFGEFDDNVNKYIYNVSFGIGSGTITIKSDSTGIADPYIYVDCDIMDCYYSNINYNDLVTIENHKWPELLPGNNIIQINNFGFDKIVVTPRWWIL